MNRGVTLDQIFHAMARASCGEQGVQLDLPADVDVDVPANRVALALNILLSDLEHQRSAAEEALRAALEERSARLAEAEDAVRARDQFLSIASHELYTPLTSLQLVVQGLRRGAASMPPDQLQHRLALAERQTRKLATLVEQLLSVSRIQSGAAVPLQLEELDLATVVREQLEELASHAERGGSELALRVDGPIVGRWDRARVEQVVSNLLGNAVKFGAGRPIEVAVAAQDAAARLTVRDHGIGIAAEALPHIFESFRRAVPASQYGGLGLGLFIVREIARAHGGSVRVESELGKGSTFIVELPCAGPPSESDEAR